MSINPFDTFMAAVKTTKIYRSRKNHLFTFGNTKLPYRVISDSIINEKSTVLRKGEVIVEKPQILFSQDGSSFEGFSGDKDEFDPEGIRYALMSRGISFPTMSYKNTTSSMEVLSDPSNVIVDRIMNEMEDNNDSRTAIVHCREDLWNLSLLHYVLGQVIQSSSANMQEYLERYPL